MQALDYSLMLSAAALGLAGTPHCAAMCTAPCAAATAGQGRAGQWSFQLARLASYSLAGAVAAAGVGALSSLSQAAPVLRPLWTMLHVAALALGLWLLYSGRQPAWMGRMGRSGLVTPGKRGGTVVTLTAKADTDSRPTTTPPWRAATAGALWAAWPCGLLQSALLVAGLTGGAAAGASAMALFAVASSGGLILGPWAWRRWIGGSTARAGPQSRTADRRERGLTRAGGALLVLASSWSLGHGLWQRVAVWCGLA